MDLPSADDVPVLDHVVMRMLSGGEAGMVCKNANSVADAESVEQSALAGLDLAVFLRHSGDAHSGVAAFKVKDAAITAMRIEPDRAAVF